jgi:hypothetical protein
MRYFLLSCFFLTTPFVFAQSIRGQLLAGPSVSQFLGDSFGGFDKLGFQAGGAVELAFSNKWGLQPEIMYAQKGSRSRSNEPFFVWRLHYVEVPLLLNYHYGEKWILQAGPSLSVLMKAAHDTGNGFEDKTEQFEQFDYNVQMGVMYTPFRQAGIALRFAQSLAPVSAGQSLRNQTLSITLRYLVP